MIEIDASDSGTHSANNHQYENHYAFGCEPPESVVSAWMTRIVSSAVHADLDIDMKPLLIGIIDGWTRF